MLRKGYDGTYARAIQDVCTTSSKHLRTADGRSYDVWLVPAKVDCIRCINDHRGVPGEISSGAAGKAIDTRTANTIFEEHITVNHESEYSLTSHCACYQGVT